jgi:uncharacterized damage-inducible protein DinB
MIVTPEYCRIMARYNAWQNDGLRKLLPAMADAAVRAERGAFFGSILATVNHLLWADRMWLSRLTGAEPPPGGIAESVAIAPTAAVWEAERFRTDGQFTLWAERLNAVDLVGDLVWKSGVTGREERRPVGTVVMHMFNHQTHHRGQVHAMLTAAGAAPGPTDLFVMPGLT